MGKYLILLFTILITSCAVLHVPCPCEAEDTIVVVGQVFKMETEIWVNKMPTVGSEPKKNTFIEVRLYTADNSSLPEDINVELYVIKPSDDSHEGQDGVFTDMIIDVNEGVIVLKDNNGPEWEEGELVDIAILVTDKNNNKKFIKNDKVEITAVY
jgi:hypothetical protein